MRHLSVRLAFAFLITATTATAGTVTVSNLSSSGTGSLADAIDQANNGICADPCTISFSVAGTIPFAGKTISASDVTIDGSTAPGATKNHGGFPGPFNAAVTVGVSGGNSSPTAFTIGGKNVTLSGLAIQNYTADAVIIDGNLGAASDNTVEGCIITNNKRGVTVQNNAKANLIGTGRPATNPLLAGNGTGSPGDRNLIGSNTDWDVAFINSTNNAASGNFLGVAANGTSALSGAIGVLISGGSTNGAGGGSGNNSNVIGGHTTAGIVVTNGATGTLINGNYVGVNISNGAVANAIGIQVDSGAAATIGGIQRNIVSGNGTGIFANGSGRVVVQGGNLIGTDSAGTTAVANTGYGIRTSGNTAGNLYVTGNTIAFNGSGGILPGGVGAEIRTSNVIYSNGGQQVDLSGSGSFVANDAGDADTGNDNLQNYPDITAARLVNGTLMFNATVDSSSVAATTSMAIDVWKADVSGGARTYVGTSGCIAGRNLQNAALQMSAPALADGDKIVATATTYANASCTTLSDGTSQLSPAVAVCVAPPAAITIDNGAAFACATSSGHVASVVNTAGATYVWSIANGTITGGQGTSSVTFTAGTAGTTTLSVTASLGACGNPSSAAITVRALPQAAINGPSTACAGVPFTLDAGPGWASYLWSTGETTRTISVSQTQQTTYSVTVSDGSCSGTTAKTIPMAFAPDATITASSAVCAGSSSNTASVPSNPNATFAWSISGGTITSSTTGNVITFDVSLNSSGVTLNVTANANGCSTSSGKSVIVNQPPAAAISAPASVCAAATGVTASTPVVAGGSYAWTINGGSITSGAGTDTITFSVSPNASTVSLGVTVTANGCTSISNANITVNPATIPVTAPASACANATGVTASTTAAAGATYSWSFTGGTITGGQGTSQITFDVNANVSSVGVSVTRTLNSCNATGSASVPIGAPDATITAPASVCAGSTGQATVPASGGASYVWSITGGTITAGANTNAITFSVPSNSNGVSLNVTVNGNSCNASSSKYISVAPVPQVSISAPSSITQNTSGNASAVANVTSTFQWSITNGTITSGQGTAAITFTAGTAAQTVLTVVATAGSCTSTASSTITAIPPITFTTTSLPTGAVGDPYSTSIIATGGSGPLTFSIVGGSLPDGLSFAANGAITGTPTRATTTAFDVQVTDGTRTAIKNFQIRIVNGLTVATNSLPNGSVGIAYQQALAAAGGTAPYTWTLASGSLPPGLTLTTGGTTTGTPTTDGTYEFAVGLTDSHGTKARGNLSITIGASLQIVTAALSGAPLGADYSFQLAAAGGTKPYKWSLTVGSLPSGIVLLADGTLTGKPTAVETAHFTVRVTDANNIFAEREFVLGTACANVSLVPPKAAAVREVTTDITYSVTWPGVASATGYDIEESMTTDFTDSTPASVTEDSVDFKHHATTPTAYFYRVRSTNVCAGLTSGWSDVIRVVIVPLPDPHSTEFHITVPYGATDRVFVPIFIAGSDSAPVNKASRAHTEGAAPPPPPNAPYTTVVSGNFVSVSPSTGTVPASGTTVTAAVSPTSLPPGTSTAVVNVSNANTGQPIASIPVSVSLVTAVSPVPAGAAAAQAMIIPAVAHVDGQSATFASDLRIANVTGAPSKYQVAFTPWGTQQQSQITSFTINPAQTILLDDVVRHLFGFGSLQDGSAGTLTVQRLDGTTDPKSTVAWAHMYSGDALSRVGQFIPSFGASQFATLGQTLSLQHLAQSTSTRTNIGLIEAGGGAVTLLAKAFDSHGTLLGQFPINLSANQNTQLNSVLLSNGVASPDARVELSVASGTGRVSAYASVIDNGTNDASLVAATNPTGVSANHYVIPGVTHVDLAGTSWRSDVRIFNPTDNALSLDVSFVPQNTSTPQTKTLSVGAHEVAALDDVVAQTFGVNDAGALHVSTGNGSTPLVVTARTYRATAAGALGQFISATTPQDATGTGGRPLHIVGVEESQAMRSNVGVYETSGAPASVDVAVTTADGRTTAHVTVDLQPYEFRQLSSILRSIGYSDTYNASVDISVKSGTGRVGGYASIIENASGDPLFVPAQ